MRILLAAAFWPSLLIAADNFAGIVGGISTLSADARAIGSPPEAISMYKPENGGTVMAFAGRDLTDYVSVQGSYGWNANDLTLIETSLAPVPRSLEQPVRATTHTLAGEALVYFRARVSAVRPYLSAGPGVVRLSARPRGVAIARREVEPLRSRFESWDVCLRVAVGIDVRIRAGFRLRYSFAETIQANPVSRELRPPGERRLANFQNLWGAVWRF